MNLGHLRAFLWLRWRLRANQFRRHGKVNAALFFIVLGIVALTGAGLFLGGMMLGLFVLAHSSPVIVLYVWDGLVVVFLFIWLTGLMTDLQRSEALSLDRFLHLPVSAAGVFLINYLTSLFSITLALFVPAMLGLTIGLVMGRGPSMLWLLPLVAAFLLMLTALTYQFQGWLASLMANKRRRRTIIAILTMSFILIAQVPNLLNVFHVWDRFGSKDAALSPSMAQMAQLDQDKAAGKITPKDYERRRKQLAEAMQKETRDEDVRDFARLEDTARLINGVLPPGWLPLGALGAAEGSLWYPLLGILGMGVIGTASLWRAYRTTVRLYTGHYTAGRRKATAAVKSAPVARPEDMGMLERSLPWVSEHASAIALATFRSLLRAPEAKMLLLTPLIMLIILGGVVLRQTSATPEMLRPIVAYGALCMLLTMMSQLMGNQFGFDRNGFRVFVLCPAPRRDVLLGKNLAIAPLMLSMAVIVIGVVAVVYPMRVDFVLALLPQAVSMYLLFCLLENWMSIIAPTRIGAGTLKPAKPTVATVLMHVGILIAAVPVVGLTLLPLGAQFLWDAFSIGPRLPIYLLLSIIECGVIVLVYRWLLRAQGDLLQAREKKILAVVTTPDE